MGSEMCIRDRADAVALKLEIQSAIDAPFNEVLCAGGAGGFCPILTRAHVRHARTGSPILTALQMEAGVARRAGNVLVRLTISTYGADAIRTCASILNTRSLWIASSRYFQMVSLETRLASSDIVHIADW